METVKIFIDGLHLGFLLIFPCLQLVSPPTCSKYSVFKKWRFSYRTTRMLLIYLSIFLFMSLKLTVRLWDKD
jgi:hypothetical protein